MTAQAQQAQDKPVTDRIETRVEVNAPRSRVWRAVSTAKEFGTWFGAELDGDFAAGATVRGRITIKGYEHLTLVEFRLAELAGGKGTAVTIVESGFDRIPLARRAEAYRMNDKGWAGQTKKLAAYVA